MLSIILNYYKNTSNNKKRLDKNTSNYLQYTDLQILKNKNNCVTKTLIK